MATDAHASTGDPPLLPSAPPGSAGRLDLHAGVEPVPGYHLVELLGRGGFGQVWQATGPGGFAVALKFVQLEHEVSEAEVRAVDVMKDVRHPHLLPLFGAWQRDGYLIVAMELAERTLHQRAREAVKQGLPGIPLAELLEYVREAAKGLDYLHAQGVQHRDVKPQNLFLVGGCVKVADFGLAKALDTTATGHTGAMTPAYSPPEFFKGQTHAASDQYALAVTYCQLRTGQLPFPGTTAEAVMSRVLNEPPELAWLAAAERAVVARALAKDPADRWPNCQEFAKALAEAAPAALHQAPTAPPAPSQPSAKSGFLLPANFKLPRPGPRGLKWLFAAGLGLALAGAVYYVLWEPRPPDLVEAGAITGHKAAVSTLAFTPDGQRLLAGDERGGLILWRAPAGPEALALTWGGEKPLHAPPGPDGHPVSLTVHDSKVNAVAVSEDGRWAVSGTEGHRVQLWDLAGAAAGPSRAGWMNTLSPQPIVGVGFALGGKQVISASTDGTVRLWDLAHAEVGGKQWPAGHGSLLKLKRDTQLAALAVAPDGKEAVTLGQDQQVFVWDLESGTKRHAYSLGHLTCLALGPNHRLAAGRDTHLQCWSTLSGGELAVARRRHDAKITCLALSRDGRFAATGAADGVVRLWDLDGNRLLGQRKIQGDTVAALAVAPDGHTVAVADGTTIRLLRAPETPR
jgi:hypothetical protein